MRYRLLSLVIAMGSFEDVNEYARQMEEGRSVTLSQCERVEATSPTMSADNEKTIVPRLSSLVNGGH